MRVVISGGGIAGLTLATKLRQQGREPIVIERAASYDAVGYAIGLWPLGSCVFHGLGCYDELVAQSSQPELYEFGDHKGGILQRVPLDAVTAGAGAPIMQVARSDILAILAKACHDIDLRMGTTITAIEARTPALASGSAARPARTSPDLMGSRRAPAGHHLACEESPCPADALSWPLVDQLRVSRLPLGGPPYRGVMEDRFFPYRFDARFAPMWLPFGVRPGRDGVTLTTDRFRATFGFLRLDTPLDNVAGGHVTEGYRWYTAVGARLSFADDGLTFGTNRERGVCVHFRAPVRRVIGFRPHSALTVTVADCDGLVEAIGEVVPAA